MSEPIPTPGVGDIMLALEKRVRERREKGIATYGRSLQAFNGRRALVDALEEAIDLAAYLEQERYERAALEADVARLREALERIRHRSASAYHCKDCNQTACSNANLGFTEEIARAALQPAPETPRAHFDRCGPFCPHTEFCAACLDMYGRCGKPECFGVRWKPAPAAPRVCECGHGEKEHDKDTADELGHCTWCPCSNWKENPGERDTSRPWDGSPTLEEIAHRHGTSLSAISMEIEQARRDVQRAVDLDYFAPKPAPEGAKLEIAGVIVTKPTGWEAKPPPPEAAPSNDWPVGVQVREQIIADLRAQLAHAKEELQEAWNKCGDAETALSRTQARVKELEAENHAFREGVEDASQAATERAEKAETERAFWQAQFDSVNLHIAQRVSEAIEERDAALKRAEEAGTAIAEAIGHFGDLDRRCDPMAAYSALHSFLQKQGMP